MGVFTLSYGMERYTESRRAHAADYFAAPMRMIVVPQTGHLPFIAGFPFFRVIATGSFISRLALHFTQ